MQNIIEGNKPKRFKLLKDYRLWLSETKFTLYPQVIGGGESYRTAAHHITGIEQEEMAALVFNGEAEQVF